MAFVYHVHLPEDKGNFDKGYIGFTSATVEERWKAHLYAAKSGNRRYPIYNAMRKYGDALVVTTLVEGSDEYCLNLEYRLRPTPNMGWNISCGGGAPMLGISHSQETIAKMRDMSPERRKAISDRMKALEVWEHGSADKLLWSNADQVYVCFCAHEDIGPVLLARAYNLTNKQLEKMHTMFKNGWIPNQDDLWLEWKSQQPAQELKGWKVGDALLSKNKPELTNELRKAMGKGGLSRVWSEEAREKLRVWNTGRKMSKEAVEKMRQSRIGTKYTEEQVLALKKRLKEMPWTNARAIHENWSKAFEISSMFAEGKTMADILRDFNLPRKSGTLQAIFNKLKSGWIPSQDPAYMTWLEAYQNNKEISNAT